jgi:hypothetical protein
MAWDEDYAPVIAPDEEEEKKRNFLNYAPVLPPEPKQGIPYDYAPAEPKQTLAAAAPPVSTAPVAPAPITPVEPKATATPAEQRMQALITKGAPPVEPLHGWKKALDIAAQTFKPTRPLEAAIRNAPQREYQANLAGAEKDVAAERALNPQPKPKEEEWAVVPGMVGPKGELVQQEKNSGQIRFAPNIAGVGPTKPPVEGEMPLGGQRIDQYNKTLTDRYQVLNPGKPLPEQYQLPANATQKDYDRVDKALEATERAQGTKAQQDTLNEMRNEARRTAATNQENIRAEREEKAGHKPVQGTDKNGRTVLVSEAEAKRMGLSNIMEAPTTDVSKAMSARQWIPLAKANGTTPDEMGLLQIVDALDKKNALGPLASRWNDFMIGTWGGGTGDPETDALFEALRTKIGLSQTLLMNLHVGSRGGSYMLEHFEDLANQKKLNANLLRIGIKSELNYAEDRAMLPTGAGGGGGETGGPKPPKEADTGMKWQHRTVDGKTEWRQVKQ